MEPAEYFRLDLKNLIMKQFLGRGEFDDHCFRLSCRKVSNIPAPCSVDYSREGVQSLKIRNQLHALFRCHVALHESTLYPIEFGTLSEYCLAPGSRSGALKSLTALDLHWVPVYREQIPPDKANELLRRNRRIVAVGFDILQVPTYKVAFELAE